MPDHVRNIALLCLISETGWMNAKFARAVNAVGTEMRLGLRYDATAVWHWLRGTVPRPPAQAAILECLSRRLGRTITSSAAGFGADAPTPEAPDTVAALIDLWSVDMDPSRRTVLGAVGLYSVTLAVPEWPDVVDRARHVKTTPGTRIGANDVATVTAMSAQLSSLDDEFGGRVVRPLASAFLGNTVADFLKCNASEKTQKAMFSAAADLAYLTGWMAMDANQNGLAQQYYQLALRLAGQAGDHLTYCTALRGMSVQAVGLGHGRIALQYADSAAAAAPAAGPRMRAFLVGQQAHASAAVGDRNAAKRQLKEAETALEKATSRTGTVAGYHPAALHYHTSHVRYELGDLGGSIAAMEESNRYRPQTERRARARSTALLAERQFEYGHLEAACATWGAFLDDYPHVSSARCDDHFATLRRSVQQHRGNKIAQALGERARTLSTPVRKT
ncbi:tetratricopeptide repeat protein [Streptomyces bluensis]|uniref:tetratricopeptide repeat protein n=1 Tax=Streptomyces bluensis TaxID=33897 RepID=UPI00167979E6|nr:tetratricopeptide repeat protein [Streptomyces bluensis]GGZ70054.1 Tat pathway signal protein [Streptomyces bluensis]